MSGGALPLEPVVVLDAIREALPEAARAPSAHNTQPARWTVDAAGRVVLVEDLLRWLSEADPTKRDHLLSLGAAWEGMDLALGRRGLGLGEPEPVTARREGTLGVVARARLVKRASSDPLARVVGARRTWRGRFPSAGAGTAEAALRVAASSPGATWIDEPGTVARLAARYDACLVEALGPSPVLRELRSWMRLSRRDVRSARDGLTAPTMQLPAGIAPVAGQLLRPKAFSILRALGLARSVVSESTATRSAMGLLVLSRLPEDSLLACGRRLYRAWLGLTASGLAACPMSALLDAPQGLDALADHLSPPFDVPISVLRVGPAPSGTIPESPRLPPEALLVEGSLP
jgi:nitroreductase